MQPQELSTQGKQAFANIEFDKDEKLMCEIRKHPFGLFIVYFIGFFVAAAILVATLVTAHFFNGDPLETGTNLARFRPVVLIVGLILAVLTVLLTFVGAFLYKSNVILVTSEKIAQVLYQSLFNRKISQLSIGDVQDVTVKQTGVLPRLFNYGTLVIETAGEQQNYTFTYTPNPYQASKCIVGAHEMNLKQYGN